MGDSRNGPTNVDAACALAQAHPKSAPVPDHYSMEGERTGLPHVTPVSLRFQNSHARMGTSVSVPEKGP